jgi:hypothetical protein
MTGGVAFPVESAGSGAEDAGGGGDGCAGEERFLLSIMFRSLFERWELKSWLSILFLAAFFNVSSICAEAAKANKTNNGSSKFFIALDFEQIYGNAHVAKNAFRDC